MSSKIIISAMLAIGLATGGSAFADDHRNDKGRNSHSQHDNRGHDNRNDKHDDKHHDNGKHNGRGAGPQHNYHKGGYVSREYRQRQYVVNDWHGRHLHAPPRGYQWVQTGPDYVLIAISTGLIAQIVLSN